MIESMPVWGVAMRKEVVAPLLAPCLRNDGQGVLLCQQGGDVGAEGRVAAVVADDLGAVQGNGGAGVDTLKLQPDLLGVRGKGGLLARFG